MKIKAKRIPAILFGVVFSFVFGMVFTQLAASDTVYFSKTPQAIQLPQTELTTPPPTPPPLTSTARLSAVNSIRNSIGQPLTKISPPANVILRPDAPKSGASYYKIYEGNNYPEIPATLIGQGKFLFFVFNTIPGKTYMVDFSVNSFNNPISLRGVYTGSATPSLNNHIIIGFTANSSVSNLTLYCNTHYFCFFRGELTQVN